MKNNVDWGQRPHLGVHEGLGGAAFFLCAGVQGQRENGRVILTHLMVILTNAKLSKIQ